MASPEGHLVSGSTEIQIKSHKNEERVPDAVRARSREMERFVPRAPECLSDTGLANSTVEQLILKLLYFRGDMMSSELARTLGLKFTVIEELIDGFKSQQFAQVKSSLGYGPVSAVLSLTERGRRVARDYLEVNLYVGG